MKPPGKEGKLCATGSDTVEHVWGTYRTRQQQSEAGQNIPLKRGLRGWETPLTHIELIVRGERWYSQCWSWFCFVLFSQSLSEACKNKNSFYCFKVSNSFGDGYAAHGHLKQTAGQRGWSHSLSSASLLILLPQDSSGTWRAQRIFSEASGAMGAQRSGWPPGVLSTWQSSRTDCDAQNIGSSHLWEQKGGPTCSATCVRHRPLDYT